MDPFETKEILDSFEILVDTREQDTERSRERYAAFGCPYSRAKLEFGDYTWQFKLHGEPYWKIENPVIPYLSIERKMSLDELAMCFGKDRQRFTREFERLKAWESRMIIIVEDANWENLIHGKYRSKLHPSAYKASVIAWLVRYNCNVLFCKAESSGELIKEILYRDLKERLERGDFDAS